MEEIKTGEIKTRVYDMSGLRLCLYGLILTVININIQGFDIFPDVIGYILVIVGLGKIEAYEANFNLAKRIAYILAVLAAINIVKPQNQDVSGSASLMQTTGVTFSAGIFGNVPWLALLFMLVGMAASIAFAVFAFIAMILFLLLINHTYRSVEGTEAF